MAKDTLLLHACCGPCSTLPLERFQDTFAITGFFYNPNIQPGDEYEKRKAAACSYYHLQGVPLCEEISDAVDWEKYVVRDDVSAMAPEGGARCERCFQYRLDRTAKEAVARGFTCFGTTLTVSPYKNTQLINSIGEALSQRYGIRFLSVDLKQDNGYQRSVELSKKAGLYRQKYCGCRFSIPRLKSSSRDREGAGSGA